MRHDHTRLSICDLASQIDHAPRHTPRKFLRETIRSLSLAQTAQVMQFLHSRRPWPCAATIQRTCVQAWIEDQSYGPSALSRLPNDRQPLRPGCEAAALGEVISAVTKLIKQVGTASQEQLLQIRLSRIAGRHGGKQVRIPHTLLISSRDFRVSHSIKPFLIKYPSYHVSSRSYQPPCKKPRSVILLLQSVDTWRIIRCNRRSGCCIFVGDCFDLL